MEHQMASNHSKLGYRVVFCSSEDPNHPFTELMNPHAAKGWQSKPHCEYPQEIILQLDSLSYLSQTQIISHHSKICSKVEIWIGAPTEGQALIPVGAPLGGQGMYPDAVWKRLGHIRFQASISTEQDVQARERKNVDLEETFGQYLKLVLHKNHPNPKNTANQIGIFSITIFGTGGQPKESGSGELASTSSSLTPRETESMDTIIGQQLRELTKAKVSALEVEDYLLAKEIKQCIEQLRLVGIEIAKKELAKKKAVVEEDYDLAAQLKQEVDDMRIEALRRIPEFSGKDNTLLEQLLEARTKRTPRLMSASRQPSFREEQPIRPRPSSGIVKSVPEMEQPLPAQRHTAVMEERAISPPQEQPQEVYRPSMGATQPVRPPSRAINPVAPYSAEIYKDEEIVAPPKKAAPGELVPDELPTGKRKEWEPFIALFGEHNILCLNSKPWQLRETAIKNIQKSLPTLQKQHADTASLLKSVCKILEKGFGDKITHVVYASVSAFQDAIGIVGINVSKVNIQTAITPLIVSLVEKLGDGNAKTREVAVSTLLFLAEQPNIGAGFVAGFLLKKLTKSQLTQWKHITGKLDLVAKLVPSYGLDVSETSLASDAVLSFINSCFDNPNAEVRTSAVNVAVEVFKVDPQLAEQGTSDAKPQIKEILQAKFAEIKEASPKNTHKAKPVAPAKNTHPAPTKQAKQAAPPPAKAAPPAVKKVDSKSPKPPLAYSSDVEESHSRGHSKAPSQELSEVYEEDFEEETNDECTCQWCGLQDPDFVEEANLDSHLMTACPLLIECGCEQVIEVSSLNEHLLTECQNAADFTQCPRCKEAVLQLEYEKHMAAKTCKPASKDPNQQRCPLCKIDVAKDEGGVAWKKHMFCCPENPRKKQ